MKYFLITYDRGAGQILALREFAEKHRAAALAERFARESEFRSRGDVEVVVLGAASLEDLRKTHSRYFMGVSEPPVDRAG